MPFSYRSRLIFVMGSATVLVGVLLGLLAGRLFNATSDRQVRETATDLNALPPPSAVTPNAPTTSPTAGWTRLQPTMPPAESATAPPNTAPGVPPTIPSTGPTVVAMAAPTARPSAVPTIPSANTPTAVPTSVPTTTPLP